ncbi:hypothetical protein [Jannaschia sp. W003]|uniref:hypothetical protein n=1 Tax=Jannaschia sp. W003 TaxID=2867012 RepID=UPI0021A83E48|nr:hypothetical protein [Jannaschia sp. W003]UWQ19976.1 hypothetical protein K3554_08065 [Jannaschia sp. W003]
MTVQRVVTAEERRDEWYSGFAHGDDEHFWDYGPCIRELPSNTLEIIEGIVGVEDAADPLLALVEAAEGDGGVWAETWRETFEKNAESAGEVWPIARRIDAAGLYGVHGVTPATMPLNERAAWLEDLVNEVVAYADASGLALEDNAVARIVRIARSRRALDTGTGVVDVGSLAILGGVSEERVRNLMSSASPTLEGGFEGGATAASALAWLQKRPDFRNSIWNHREAAPQESAPLDPEAIIFVPMARDGSIFHPHLWRHEWYWIGGKREERRFRRFDDALAALNAMPVPRWRRPNEQGDWETVAGVAWQRIDLSADDDA